MAGYADLGDTIILVFQQFAFLAHKKKSKKHIVVKIASNNPIWLEANQLATNKFNRGTKLVTTKNNSILWPKWDRREGFDSCESGWVEIHYAKGLVVYYL